MNVGWVLPCACGSTICADPDDPMLGVRAHQLTSRHAAWARRWLSPGPTAVVSRDVSASKVRPAGRELLVGLGYEL